MGITWDRPMKRFVAACLAGAAQDRKGWSVVEEAFWGKLERAGLVTPEGELLASLYGEALEHGVLDVQATFKVDLGVPVFALYAAQALGGGAYTQPISVSAPLRLAVALGLAHGRFIVKHAQSGDYAVVAR